MRARLLLLCTSTIIVSHAACPFGAGNVGHGHAPSLTDSVSAWQNHHGRNLLQDISGYDFTKVGSTGLPPLDPFTGPDEGGDAHVSRNGFMNQGGQTGVKIATGHGVAGNGQTMIDMIAALGAGELPGMENAPGVGNSTHPVDMCIWNFQSLPPPVITKYKSPTVERGYNPADMSTGWKQFYEYPINDLPKLNDLCSMASARLQAHVENKDANGGAIVFAGCAQGTEASHAFCNQSITGVEGTYCTDRMLKSKIKWPQAITMFKINKKNKQFVYDILKNWRSSADQHLPNLFWAYGSGRNQTGNENPEIFTSKLATSGLATPKPKVEWGTPNIVGSHEPGWGNNGGLRAKIVPCNLINPRFMYPNISTKATPKPATTYYFGSGAPDPLNENKTFGESAYEEWQSLCAYPMAANYGGKAASCTPCTTSNGKKCTPATPPPPKTPDVTPPTGATTGPNYGWLPHTEQCRYKPTYRANSIACGAGIAQQWGNDSYTKIFDKAVNDGNAVCAKQFCASLTYLNMSNASTVGYNMTTGLIGCYDAHYGPPKDCNDGYVYMKALKQIVECLLRVDESVAKTKYETSKKLAAETTSVGICPANTSCAGQSIKYTGAQTSIKHCINMTVCDAKTIMSSNNDWGVAFCQNFFKTLKDPWFGHEFDKVKNCPDSPEGGIWTGNTYAYCYNVVFKNRQGQEVTLQKITQDISIVNLGSYTGDTKFVYERAYALTLGMYDTNLKSLMGGRIGSSYQGDRITFFTQIPEYGGSKYISGANAAWSASDFEAKFLTNIATVNAALGKSAPVPSAAHTTISPQSGASGTSADSSASASPAPKPTHTISATVQMSGVTKSQFTGNVVKTFKAAAISGFSGFWSLPITTDDVVIDMDSVVDVSTRRATSLKVPFKVNIRATKPADANTAATDFAKFLKSDDSSGFYSTLKAKVQAAGLTAQFDVKGVTVTSEPTAASVSSSSSSSFAGWKIALIVIGCVLFLVLIVGLIICAVVRRDNMPEHGVAHTGSTNKKGVVVSTGKL